MPSPVSAIIDKTNGAVVAIAVIGRQGTQYIAKVDPRDASRMLLTSPSDKKMYYLKTRYDNISLANRQQIESIFRVANWEAALLQ